MKKIKVYKCTKGFVISNDDDLEGTKDLLIEGGTEWYLSDEFISPYTVRLISTKDGEWVWVEIDKEELEQHFKLLTQY
ncbi:hypothetical protein [Fusobacterium varium]